MIEARIAPAEVLSLIDGDLITTTEGTDPELLAAVSTFVPAAGAVPGGVALETTNLQCNPGSGGTSLRVTAKRGPLGGAGATTTGRTPRPVTPLFLIAM